MGNQRNLWLRAFPVGSAPKTLTRKRSTATFLEYRGDDRKLVVSALEAARNSTKAQPLWQVQHNAAKQRISPTGVAIVLSKHQQVPGGGKLVLD